MNANLSSFTPAQAQTLYGSETFQVRLVQLQAGETIPAYPQAPTTRTQVFVVDGALSVHHQTPSLSKGQRGEFSAEQPVTLENQTSHPLTLIEIQWGSAFKVVPLVEVTETRPWGSFTVLKDEPNYKLKQLAVNPGNRLSLQRHQQREEHWLVTQGHPEVTLDESLVKLSAGEYIRIPRHSWHRISNPANQNPAEQVEIIELQLGDYFGEDDIERQQDDYGRN